jgi:imidazole glycerol-phosphate synthase subunit HisF
MLRTRVIPCLLLNGVGMVKTVKFANPKYVGDPINAIRIFNQMEVDELVLLDIKASAEGRGPSFSAIEEVATECYMPFAYGGGIRDLADIRKILALGVEKVVLNSMAVSRPELVTEAAKEFGEQAIVVSIDARKKLLGGYDAMILGGKKTAGSSPVELARQMADRGAGEILLNSIDRDGTQKGYDLELIRSVAGAVKIPVVALGGAATLQDLALATKRAGAAAAGAGSIFVFHGPHRAVLISYPTTAELRSIMGEQ